jgi:hypothetical protein
MSQGYRCVAYTVDSRGGAIQVGGHNREIGYRGDSGERDRGLDDQNRGNVARDKQMTHEAASATSYVLYLLRGPGIKWR